MCDIEPEPGETFAFSPVCTLSRGENSACKWQTWQLLITCSGRRFWRDETGSRFRQQPDGSMMWDASKINDCVFKGSAPGQGL
jgi:hypothetical protein